MLNEIYANVRIKVLKIVNVHGICNESAFIDYDLQVTFSKFEPNNAFQYQ